MKFIPILLITAFTLFTSAISYAQTPVWGDADYFDYDGAGNRIWRFYTYTIVAPKPGTTEEQQLDTLYQKFEKTDVVVKAYPNPASNILIIENKNWKPEYRVVIDVFDILGRRLLSQKLSLAKENIPLSMLVPGTYTVNYFLDEKLLTTWKIIKN